MRRRAPARSRRLAYPILIGYALLGVLSAGLALAISGELPIVHPEPMLRLDPAMSVASSALLGIVLALVTIALSRWVIPRLAWGRRLSTELSPIAKNLSPGEVLLVALLSSLGEELLFRGLLTPLLGVVLSSIAFGLAHQMRGPSRWVWIAWATIMGLLLGLIFEITGSLVGPLLAHAAINAANLMTLRQDASRPAPRVRPA